MSTGDGPEGPVTPSIPLVPPAPQVAGGHVRIVDPAGPAAAADEKSDDAPIVETPPAPSEVDPHPVGSVPAVAPGEVTEPAPVTTFPLTAADTATAETFGFSFTLAKIPDQGEDSDPWLHRSRDLGGVGVFDGMGGAGGRVYETADGPRTGAYLASRLVRDVVGGELMRRFSPGDELDGEMVADALHRAVGTALGDALADLHAPPSGLRSRLIRALPTTMAVAVVQRLAEDGQEWACHLFWAGDSRVYVLDPAQGVAQLTTDDIRDRADAMTNLRADSVLSNAISADTPFVVHHRRLTLTVPFLLIAATDGAFGYLPSPMHFEHLLLATLRTAGDVEDWSAALQRQIEAVTGDDAAMAVLGVGAGQPVLRELLARRGHQLENDYVRPLDGVSGDLERMELEVEILRNRSAEMSADLWSHYRTGYERYGTGSTGEVQS